MKTATYMEPAAESKSTLALYFRLLSYLRDHRGAISIALGAMVVFGASDGAIPLLLKHFLDEVFVSRNEERLWLLVGLVGVLGITRAVFGFIQRYYSLSIGLRIVERLRNEIGSKLLALSPSFFNSQSTGAIISRMTNDVLLVRYAITDATMGFLRDGLRLIALMCATLWLDPFLGIAAVIILPFAILPVVRFGRKVRRLSRSGQDLLGSLTSILNEIVVGHRVVQSFRMEEYERSRFLDENARSTKTFIRSEKYGALSGSSNELLASCAVAGILLYGGYSVLNGTRTPGDFIAFITAVLLMYEPLKKLSRLSNTVQSGAAAAERVFEIIDLEEDIKECESPQRLDNNNPHIFFDAISFYYQTPPQNAVLRSGNTEAVAEAAPEWVLQDISLSIEPGQTVALVGHSGCGKSTIANLLPRFYDPQIGAIRIDGSDIRNYSLASLRSHIALVDQHTFLFDASVLHNISYGRIDADPAEVVEAAKAANAHEFISELDDAYDTILGEQGLRLSGGQRARIAIARALLQDAPILILDEATANLDSKSERLVQEAIDRLMLGRTVIVIAHRLATVRNADRIVVLSEGKIVEQGNHDELVALDRHYAGLCRLQ